MVALISEPFANPLVITHIKHSSNLPTNLDQIFNNNNNNIIDDTDSDN